MIQTRERLTTNHSYEEFARQPFYQAVDRALLQRAPPSQYVVDFATGTGEAIYDLFQLGKIESPYTVIGIDIDPQSLAIAQEKFYGRQGVHLVQGSVEHAPLRDNSADIVTHLNAIHLTDPHRTLVQANRILRPGGTYMANTAYAAGAAYPPGAARKWGTLVILAKRNVTQATKGRVTHFQDPVNLIRYSTADFAQQAMEAGFVNIKTEEHIVPMDRKAVKAICNYDEFARGALPGIDVEIATEALVNAVDPLFDHFKINEIPRGWVFLTAEKPQSA